MVISFIRGLPNTVLIVIHKTTGDTVEKEAVILFFNTPVIS